MTASIDLKQGTQEWREARVGLITGSVIGAILGCSPFTSRKQALRRMVQEALGEFEFFQSPAMKWGTDNEDVARKQYCGLYANGATVEETGFWTKGDIGASPDSLINGDGLLEIKCPWSLREDSRPMFKSIRDKELRHYWHQCQAQMYVTERQWVDFYQWTPHDHKLERVDRDPNWLDDNIDEFAAFMGEYEEMLTQTRAGGAADRLAMSASWEVACRAFEEADAKLKDAEEAKNEAKANLVALLENNGLDELKSAGVTATKVSSKGSVQWKSVAAYVVPVDIDLDSVAESHRGKDRVSWLVKVTKDD